MTTENLVKENQNSTSTAEQDRKHLVFRLGEELYATPLIAIREISKMQSIKPVPFMVNYFLGILNLRGNIVSVVDLRLKLQLPVKQGQNGLLIVIDTASGPIAAIVDDVVSVSDFEIAQVETGLALKTKLPMEFFIGVGKLNDRLVNIIDIAGTLSSDDFATIRRAIDKQPRAA